MAYVGRSNQGLESHNFGGINTRSGLINIAQNEALDCLNFDLGPDGSLTRRNGYTVISSNFTGAQSITVFFRYDTGFYGAEWWSIITSNKIWESSNPAGTWVDRTGAVTFTVGNGVSALGYNGKLIACNGVDQPIYQAPGSAAVTLKAASAIGLPTSVVGSVVGSNASPGVTYYISAQSGRDLTNPFLAAASFATGIIGDSINYNKVGWISPSGAVATWIWKSGGVIVAGDYSIQVATVLDPTVASWSDAGVFNPVGMGFVKSGVGGSAYKYIVTATVGGVETLVAMFSITNALPVLFSYGSLTRLTIVEVLGASLYHLYVYMDAGVYTNERASAFSSNMTIPKSGYYLHSGIAGNTTLVSITDFGVGVVGSIANPLVEYTHAPDIYPAYNTPLDWDVNGQPQGFSVLAGTKAERVLAWRNSTIWGSALKNPLDWYALNDAFTVTITGGGDKNIKAIGSLVDYTVVFSASQAFVFIGSNLVDFQQIKVLPIGCASARSIFMVDNDIWFWGQYGPTNFKRVLYGQDLEANTGLSAKINTFIYASDRSQWSNIVGFLNIPNNKAIYCYTSTGGTKNDSCLVYNTLVSAWTRYNSVPIVSIAIDSQHRMFALFTDGRLVQFGVGNTDGGTSITASYNTAWYDMGTWATRKRLVWVDVIADRQLGDYTFTVNTSYDYGLRTDVPITCTQNTTDGVVVETTSTKATIHRVYSDGFGESFQLIFSTSAGDTPIKILGWRPDTRMKGIRGNG